MSDSFATTWTVRNPASLLCPWDFQARMLEWAATSFSGGSSQPRDQTHVSCIGRWILYYGAHQGSLFGLECCSNPLCLHWFYLDDISIVENGVLKFPDTVLLFIFPFSSVSFFFIYLDAQYSWSPKYNCFEIFVWQIWNLCFCKDGYWIFVLLFWMDYVSFLPLCDLRSFVEYWTQKEWGTSPSLCRLALSGERISPIHPAWRFNAFATFSGLMSSLSLCTCCPITPQDADLFLNLLISLSVTRAFSQVLEALLYLTHRSADPCGF